MRLSTSSLSRPLLLTVLCLFILFTPACKKASEKDEIRDREFVPQVTLLDEWLGAYYQGKKIGYVNSVTERGTWGGQPVSRIKSKALVEMSLEGEKSTTELEQTGYLDGEGNLLAFDYTQEIMGHRMVVRGERREDKLIVEVDAGGGKRRHTFPYSEDLTTSGLLKQAILKKPLKVGEEKIFQILLEPLLAIEPVTVRVVSLEKGYLDGKETDVYTLEESFMGIVGTVKLAANGLTLQEDSPHGFKLLNVEKEVALKKGTPLSIIDLLLASRIETSKTISKARELDQLKVKLTRLPAAFPLIEDARQKVTARDASNEGIAYSLELTRRALPEKEMALPVKERGFEIYLAADHVVNSDNRLIIDKAREIIGNERSAKKATESLYRWVNEKIGKKLVDTVSAVDTLKTGEGECQAHSNLFAAFARSVGIPTKVISGIVYSEQFEGFMYHAWNEVWLGEWIAVDATLGGFPADATHIKLSEGGLADQLKILALVGKIGVEVE